MNDLSLLIKIEKHLYLKNPNASDLGRNIISHSITLIEQLGYEKFTFKKLAAVIKSTESSIYRYFENKHQLLIYLFSWYWNWIYYKIVLATLNIESTAVKLKNAMAILTNEVKEDKSILFVNEELLHKIIITESFKVIHTKAVDKENKNGCFEAYKKVINYVSTMVLEVNPQYKFSHILITTVIEGVQQQQYYSSHLPSLTDGLSKSQTIATFYSDMVFKMIK